MQLSMGAYQRVEQNVRQMQKLELRQELKQVLALLLRLLQTIIQAQRITLTHVQELQAAVAQFSAEDADALAHELVRRGGVERASEVGMALRAVAHIAPASFGNLRDFADEIIVIVDEERHHRARRLQPRLVMAMRLIMEPPFFGGVEGTADNLAELLRAIPQRDHDGTYWVLGSGWAVELLTGIHRDHHDIDTVVMTGKPLYLDTDVVHTDDYFGQLACTRQFIERHCVRTVLWDHDREHNDGRFIEVLVLCPEFLFCSKFLREPRDKDWTDVTALVQKFAATWDLKLMRKLIRRNACGFGRESELLEILQSQNPALIVEKLERFWHTAPQLA